MKRCGWCARFVTKNTQPIPGVNRYGKPLAQTLCPDCAPCWVDLATRNAVTPYHDIRKWLPR